MNIQVTQIDHVVDFSCFFLFLGMNFHYTWLQVSFLVTSIVYCSSMILANPYPFVVVFVEGQATETRVWWRYQAKGWAW